MKVIIGVSLDAVVYLRKNCWEQFSTLRHLKEYIFLQMNTVESDFIVTFTLIKMFIEDIIPLLKI